MSPAPCFFHNGAVLTADGFRDDLVVGVEAGHIVSLSAMLPPDVSVVDLEGGYLVPGFIDTQVNGGGDVLFNDMPTVEGVRRIAEAHRAFGTTAMMPTLISDTPALMGTAIAAVREAIFRQVPGVLGIHLEGPYLAEARRGVHDASRFHTPGEDELALVSSLENGLTLLTLAPERFATRTLEALTANGVILSAGHSAATWAQATAAFDAGVRGVTHLYNAMTGLQGREPGMVGAALDHPGPWCGIIVDGHHVHDAALRLAIAAKARGKMMLVTDAMPPVGGTRGSFTLYGQPMTCRDGRCSTPEGTLAGSALDMASAVRNTVALGVPLDEACRMASTYPARFLGVGDRIGSIQAGWQADLVWLDRELRVRGTWIAGLPPPPRGQ